MAPLRWLLVIVAFAFAGASWAAEREIRIGGMCDRTGTTQNIGIEMCPGIVDYIALVNRKGGIQGHRLKYTEIDHAYMVPRAVEAYQQLKQDGVVTMLSYGMPTLVALKSRFMEDKIPVYSTGTGPSDAIDGTTWPYVFPGNASYWSQTGAAVKFLKDNGARKGTKIALLYLDNTAGREAIPMVEGVARKEGYVLRKFAVESPGVEMERQVLEITRDFKADWVITSLFSGAPSVSIKEFRRAGFPMNRVLAFVYGAGDNDVEDAGWDIAQGYYGLQYASVGRNFPVIQDLIKMYRDESKEVPKYVGGVYYNRGVLNGAVIVEAIRLAIRDHGLPLTPDKVRKGYEAIRNFDAHGLVAPLNFTPQDHEGGGYLRVYQVKGREWVPVSGWIRDYRDDVMALVRKANEK